MDGGFVICFDILALVIQLPVLRRCRLKLPSQKVLRLRCLGWDVCAYFVVACAGPYFFLRKGAGQLTIANRFALTAPFDPSRSVYISSPWDKGKGRRPALGGGSHVRSLLS